jgi:hypothetical protein
MNLLRLLRVGRGLDNQLSQFVDNSVDCINLGLSGSYAVPLPRI